MAADWVVSFLVYSENCQCLGSQELIFNISEKSTRNVFEKQMKPKLNPPTQKSPTGVHESDKYWLLNQEKNVQS